MQKRRVVILGSTGSIGTSALKVARDIPDRMEIVGLAAGTSVEALASQAREFNVRNVCIYDPSGAAGLAASLPGAQVETGEEGLCRLAQLPEADMVLISIVGTAGLKPALAAIEAGKDLAIASKEILVMAGQIVMEKARRAGVQVLPVDSEHNAIFQCLNGSHGGPEAVSRLILTASGGPFRTWNREDLEHVTLEQALKHPTWSMGRKITIDSATLFNKGLEMIEARWLFDVPMEKVDVIVHPQSIVHSMVEYRDGTVLAYTDEDGQRRYNNSADTRHISPFLMDYGIFTSYYEFGPHGIVNRPDNGVVGSAIGGTTCTDRWIMDNSEKGGPLTVDRYQTQHIWFTHDENGEEISRPTSFIAEAQVTADVSAYTSGQATFGIMTIHDMWSMVTYGVNMSNLINGKQVVLQSIEGIDSSYWVGQQSMSKTVNSDYTANTVCLRLVKLEGYYYYFYKNPSDAEYTYIGYEYWYKNSEDVDVGLFTNCPSTITNYSVADYTGREDELESILSETVYFVDTSNVSGGDVNGDQMVVRQGDALTITATPTNGYILNEFTINGEDMFDEFVEAKGSLEYIPEIDVVIEAKFVRIPQEYLQTVSYTVTDPAGNFVSNADYTITSENPLLSKTGTTSGRGMIATSMPRACEFTIGGRKYVCDGEYELFLSKDTYLDTSDAFTLTGGEDIEKTLVMRDARWGKDPMVNGNRQRQLRRPGI